MRISFAKLPVLLLLIPLAYYEAASFTAWWDWVCEAWKSLSFDSWLVVLYLLTKYKYWHLFLARCICYNVHKYATLGALFLGWWVKILVVLRIVRFVVVPVVGVVVLWYCLMVEAGLMWYWDSVVMLMWLMLFLLMLVWLILFLVMLVWLMLFFWYEADVMWAP